MTELNVTTLEELDLLVKYTGAESRRHIISIKSSNISDPRNGLEKAWNRLEERYGCPEMLEASIKRRIECFSKLTNKDSYKLYDLYDLASEIDSIKRNEKMKPLLSHYDSSIGVTPLVNKLPHNLQEKWTHSAVKYMSLHNIAYPPFSHFVSFLQEQSRIRNNPSFVYEISQANKRDKDTNFQRRTEKSGIHVRKTETEENNIVDFKQTCPFHLTNHPLNNCRMFKTKPISERIKLLKEKKICFKCCESDSYVKRDCTKTVVCQECKSNDHPTALHIDSSTGSSTSSPNNQASTQNRTVAHNKPTKFSSNHGGENSSSVNSRCTRICGEFAGKSCAKIVLVNVYMDTDPNKKFRIYVMLDDQSNRTLATSSLFNIFDENCDETEYILTSCSGKTRTSGRQTSGLVIESLDRSVQLNLPTILECNDLPENRNEIPTPEVAQNYYHLQDIMHLIPPIDDEARIMMLIRRDVIKAHHVLDHRIGPANTPYAQRLPLGWTIIGESCLGSVHQPNELTVSKTSVLLSGRPTLFRHCETHINMKESDHDKSHDLLEVKNNTHALAVGNDIFVKTPENDKPGLSIEDRSFLSIMDTSFHMDSDGNWSCPLPFKEKRPILQNNYEQVLKRAHTLDKSLRKDQVKKEHFIDFVASMLNNGHAEKAPPLKKDEEVWYLPIFGVYHRRKKDKVRVVFDSAARYNGVSLNDVLLSGPDLTNSLLGILLRFRREHVAVVADIQQMFYCFKVDEKHRNYLRFLWHDSNDLEKPLVEYRMCVHIFGNTASPAIATFGLQLAASRSALGLDVTNFVKNDFYVDDGLTSMETPESAVDLIKRTQEVLQSEGGLRLHKIASNHKDVMQAFSPEDLAKDLEDVELGNTSLPEQHSLGVKWSLETDSIIFEICTDDKPYTRRGVLSTINSLFDPLGFLAPVVIEGKLILRELISSTSDWDDPLPPTEYDTWIRWVTSLDDLKHVSIPRTYLSCSFNQSKNKSVHIFCDASENAIATVAYLRAENNMGDFELGFLLGKSKVAPIHGHTIPRLELCSAVLSTELAVTIDNHLQLPIKNYTFYTDSKVVFGYINNESRRFYTYVSNRVQKIRSCTLPSQWKYVSTDKNPADKGTRTLAASEMCSSPWLTGPTFLRKSNVEQNEHFELQNPDHDKEVRQKVNVQKSNVSSQEVQESLVSKFEKFSEWKHLVDMIGRLKHIAQAFSKNNGCEGWHVCQDSRSVECFETAKIFVLRQAQQDMFKDEIRCLSNGKPILSSSNISSLSPYLSADGLLRVGGRLENASIPECEKHPILIAGHHHIATLLVRHFHDRTFHKGRHITEGAIRSAGIWITRAKSLVSSVISKCVKCRKLRGTLSFQKMAHLPQDRLEPGPPFSNVGVDCFGPWEIVARKTRGGHANNKRWAVMFSCLTTRGAHIEVVEELSSSSFIMALKRFIAIRGPVTHFRSDRGTNFVGSTDDLGIQTINVEDMKVKEYLQSNGSTWQFNPPHASHMGGVWERVTGITRRILDSILIEVPGSGLTHEMLVTFLAEASAIVNSRPLVPLTTDPDDPMPLSPSLLLTQKPQQFINISDTIDCKDIFNKQWKRVQFLAQQFWNRWRIQYLQTLQNRQKWTDLQRNISEGDIVMLRDKQCARNSWPLGIVVKTHAGSDKLVRSCEVLCTRDGRHVYTRPVTELVLFVPRN